MSFSFNNTVNGKGNNFAQGQNVTQNINQKFDPGKIPEVVSTIEQMAKEAANTQPAFPESEPELIQEFGTPQNLLSVAATEVEQELESEPLPEPEFEERKTTWMNRFQAIAPSALSIGIAGGEALLAASPASRSSPRCSRCATPLRQSYRSD